MKCLFLLLVLASASFLGCGGDAPAPKPTANVPPKVASTPAPPASAPTNHATHAHESSPKKSGKGKMDVVRLGVESLDVYVDAGTIYLLLGDYDATTKVPALRHLRSTDGGATWSTPGLVDTGATPPHAPHRGMDAQIAAHGQRLIALWNTPGTGFNGRGPLATALSADGGTTWQPGPNPADDASNGDHSFADCAADASGTFHLVWLDSRGAGKGLRYANSRDGGRTWSKNATLKADTCECCWNQLTIGSDGTLHVLFRDKQPRDMALVSSHDHGATWEKPVTVGAFNWDFPGCPHVGGGLLALTNTLHAVVWTGAAGHGGAYHLRRATPTGAWSAPQPLGDSDARRGDLASRDGQHIAAVWDRIADGESQVFAAQSGDSGGTWSAPQPLSTKGVNASYPRIVAVNSAYRVFWTEHVPNQPGVWKSASLNQ